MIGSLVSASLRLRSLVVVLAVLVMAVGITRLNDMPVDVFPEILPVTVHVQTEALGLSAEEVERVLNSHPLVVESAVVGVPDPIRQEEIKAFIVLKPPATPDTLPAKELWDFCRKHLAPFKIPREWVFLDALPRTASGKLLRRTLH